MVRDFQKIIGMEAKRQILEKEARLPDYIVAAVGGGSNAMGIFYPFIEDKEVQLIGVEGAGHGIETGEHSATMSEKKKGVLHGMMTYLLRDDYGNIKRSNIQYSRVRLSSNRSRTCIFRRNKKSRIC